MAQPKLTAEQQAIWSAHALSVYPEEAVAILTSDNELIPMKNSSPTPKETFRVAVEDFWPYNDKITALIHSHTYDLADPYLVDKRVPSKQDLAGQINHNVWWGISVTEGENVSDPLWFGFDREEPYEGREFIFNVNDCFELVRDWYRRELQVEIPPYARDWNWQDEENLFDDNFTKAGFVDVQWEDLQKGDVIYFNIASEKTNHVGVYLGDDIVLHHLYGRLSGTETLSRWRRQVSHIIRRAV